jgi:N-acetyl-anhydromuramyl-L-alanine amidase AmpD
MALKAMSPQDVKLFVIHCSATQAKSDVGAKEIDQWHKQRGFLKIGYHFVIRRGGTVEAGRKLSEPGAHAQGVNSKSIGICMVGGIDAKGKAENNFTPAQFTALANLLHDLKRDFPHVKTIIGHRDVQGVKKECPSFSVKDWLEERGIL